MTYIKHKLLLVASLLIFGIGAAFLLPPSPAFAKDICGGPITEIRNGVEKTIEENKSVTTAIDIGCTGKGNPIKDMTFGIIRFLSAGVGLVVVASVIVAGIQYSASAGDPQAAAKAKSRISSTLVALLIFIFSYALLNYLIPGGFLNNA